MATRDTLGIMRPGMFEQITLPSGQKATPVSGNGRKTTFNVNGTLVQARTADPREIEHRLMMAQMKDRILWPGNK